MKARENAPNNIKYSRRSRTREAFPWPSLRNRKWKISGSDHPWPSLNPPGQGGVQGRAMSILSPPAPTRNCHIQDRHWWSHQEALFSSRACPYQAKIASTLSSLQSTCTRVGSLSGKLKPPAIKNPSTQEAENFVV